MPLHRYRSYNERFTVDLSDRTWPSNVITATSVWRAVDLRDGNQSLLGPMSSERKRTTFDLLTRMGYKQIDVDFPPASQSEFDFLRQPIANDLIPDA